MKRDRVTFGEALNTTNRNPRRRLPLPNSLSRWRGDFNKRFQWPLLQFGDAEHSRLWRHHTSCQRCADVGCRRSNHGITLCRRVDRASRCHSRFIQAPRQHEREAGSNLASTSAKIEHTRTNFGGALSAERNGVLVVYAVVLMDISGRAR